jgi:hypothetical protein
LSSRNHLGIECARVIVVFGAVLSHTHFMANYDDPISRGLFFFSKNSKCLLPIFFVIAGYFWGKKIRAGNDLLEISYNYGMRLLKLWIFWNIIYILIPSDRGAIEQYGLSAILKVPFWRLTEILKDPISFLFVGTISPLWYLMALLWALAISTIILKYTKGIWLIWLGSLLYLFGLLAGTYSATPIGIPIHFFTRFGPFYSTIFFATGWFLSSDSILFSTKTIYLMFFGGIGLIVLEFYFLFYLYGLIPTSIPYLFGNLPFAIGTTLLFFSKPELWKKTGIPKLGKYVLGIYVIHYMLIDLFKAHYKGMFGYLWDLTFPGVIFLCSLLAVMILSHNRYLRQFII